jgi:hypothetical protein
MGLISWWNTTTTKTKNLDSIDKESHYRDRYVLHIRIQRRTKSGALCLYYYWKAACESYIQTLMYELEKTFNIQCSLSKTDITDCSTRAQSRHYLVIRRTQMFKLLFVNISCGNHLHNVTCRS